MTERNLVFDASNLHPQHLLDRLCELARPSLSFNAFRYSVSIWPTRRWSEPSCLALLSSDGLTVEDTCRCTDLQLSNLLILFKDPSCANFDLL